MIVYEGVRTSGEKVKGKFLGNREDLLKFARTEGIIITSIKEDFKKKKNSKLKLRKIYESLEELSYLLSSGLKIDDALSTLSKTSDNFEVREFWIEVLQRIREGNQFSEALKKELDKKKLYFPHYYISILQVGEKIGNICPSIQLILEDVEFKENIKKEIISSLTYPVFILIMSFISIIFMAVLVIPKFTQIFTPEELSKLPLISKVVISTGFFLKKNINILMSVFIFFLLLPFLLFKNRNWRENIIKYLYNVPYLSSFFLKLELSKFLKATSTMLKAGINIDQAIKFSMNVTKHPLIIDLAKDIQKELKKGKKISYTLSKHAFIPADLISLVTIGEASSKLPEVLSKVSEKYIINFRENIKKALSLIEPLAIIITGLIIGFIVVSIFIAIVSITDIV